MINAPQVQIIVRDMNGGWAIRYSPFTFRLEVYRFVHMLLATRQCTLFSAASISPTRQSIAMLASEYASSRDRDLSFWTKTIASSTPPE
jgi:hypothetical protein